MIIWKTNYNIPKKQIDSLISDLKKDDRSFGKDIDFYSSYYLPVSERPEKKITSVYNDIITKGSKQLGLFKINPPLFKLINMLGIFQDFRNK